MNKIKINAEGRALSRLMNILCELRSCKKLSLHLRIAKTTINIIQAMLPDVSTYSSKITGEFPSFIFHYTSSLVGAKN